MTEQGEAYTGMEKWLPLSGAVAVVAIVAGIVALGGDTPGSNESTATISAYYSAHRGREIAAALVVAAAAPFLALFAVALARSIAPADARAGVWPGLLRIGGATCAAGFLGAGFIHFALADAADQSNVPAAALQPLNALDADSWVLFNSGLGVLMLGAGATLLARRAYPVLGWIALVAGVLLFIPFADFFALLVSGVWIIVTGVIAFRRGGVLAPER
jgi:hypothetical protein